MDPEDLLKHNIDYGQRQQMIRQLQNQQPKGPPCPYCGGPIPRIGVKICMHCRNKLSWVDHTPCEPGQEGVVRRQQVVIRQRQAVAQKNANNTLIICCVIGLLVVLGPAAVIIGVDWKQKSERRQRVEDYRAEDERERAKYSSASYLQHAERYIKETWKPVYIPEDGGYEINNINVEIDDISQYYNVQIDYTLDFGPEINSKQENSDKEIVHWTLDLEEWLNRQK